MMYKGRGRRVNRGNVEWRRGVKWIKEEDLKNVRLNEEMMK